MSSSKATRKYERLLFKGIPEQPEHTFERDQNSNVGLTVTGRSKPTSNYNDSDETEILGYISYDFKNQKKTFRPSKVEGEPKKSKKIASAK